MGIPSDDVVLIRQPERPGEPSVITVSCPDKTGLGCDLCRVILLFGLNIVKGDMSTDGKWCYVVFWVVSSGGRGTRWGLLKRRLAEMCPVVSLPLFIDGYYSSTQQESMTAMGGRVQVFLLKFCCYDRMGLLHDVTQVLCELELTIRGVKVSTTPDGRVLDLFLITDCWDLLHTKNRREEACSRLRTVLGDSVTSCEIEPADEDMSACLQASSLPHSITEQMFGHQLQEEPCSSRNSLSTPTGLSVTMDNSLSPAHTLIQIQCGDHKGLLYDIMRTLKDYNIQICYGRFYTRRSSNCEIDLFGVQMDGKKIIDPNKQQALCSRLRMELSRPLRVYLVDRGPDTELLVANPVEISGKGRPLVFYDITLALKMLQIRIFLAEIGRHFTGDREWEVYRIHLGEGHELCASRNKIVEEVRKTLLGWK